MEQLRPETRNPLTFFGTSLFDSYDVFPMFQKTLIMTKYQINFLHSTNEYWWLLFIIILCQIMYQPRLQTENSKAIYFLFHSYHSYFHAFLFMETINMFRVVIPPPQPLSPKYFICFLSIIIIIIMSSWCFKQTILWHRIRSMVCTTQSITG